MVKASVMEIYDLQTSVGKGTVLKVHTPTGNNIKRHLLGHFLQYKKFKYLGAKVTLVPASTLPADPLQLSYDAGEANIDPRDMVNPILWKHYHGETMLTDVLPADELKDYDQKTNLDTAGTNGSALEQALYGYRSASSALDSVYPRTLMDTSFRKAGIQTGFTTFCKPFVYNVVSNVQLLPRSGTNNTAYPAYFMNSSFTSNPEDAYPVFMKHSGTASQDGDMLKGPGTTHWIDGVKSTSTPQSQTGGNLVMTTNKLVPLGWMDTLSREGPGGTENINSPLSATAPGANFSGDASFGANLQSVPMLYILMPPAYKTEFYFRMIIKHYYAFSGFRSCFSVQSFPSVGLYQNLPVPDTYYGTPSKAISSMVAEIESDSSVNTVDVENGVLHSMADGVEGE